MVERTQLLSFVSHNLLKKELTDYLLPLGKIYNLTPAKFKSFSSPVCSHNMNNTDKPTDFQEDGSYFQRRRSSFFSHTCAHIMIWYKSGILHQRLPSETMDAILLFNANFNTYANHVIQKLF